MGGEKFRKKKKRSTLVKLEEKFGGGGGGLQTVWSKSLSEYEEMSVSKEEQ